MRKVLSSSLLTAVKLHRMAEAQSVEGLAVLEHHPLKPYTTFKIGGPARFFVAVETLQDVARAIELARSEKVPVFVLGGGSNVLVSDAGVQAVVIHPVNRGVAVVREDRLEAWITVEAGEVWDDLVASVVKRGWWGIENLSHIPGQVGAALVQNIGAYGQQISDALECVEVVEFSTGKARTVSKEECRLGYRRSIFNTTQKGAYLILNVTLRLSKRGHPNLIYPDVRSWFEERGRVPPFLQQIRQAIIRIRDNKFPFPRHEIGGNAGSFFKNIVLSQEAYAELEQRLQQNFTPAETSRLRDLRSRFPSIDGIKIPTAFLMEICGLKQYRMGRAQVNETQPLVLLNRGGASAREVILLARKVRQTVFERTGIAIAIEPELVGFTQAELEEYLVLEG
jgi:UDP-N-acetylmuramate dehydrogenase